MSAITQGDNSSLLLDTGSARDDLTSVVTTHLRASVDKDYAMSLASIVRRLGRTSRVVDTPDVLAMLYFLKGVCCNEEGFPAVSMRLNSGLPLFSLCNSEWIRLSVFLSRIRTNISE